MKIKFDFDPESGKFDGRSRHLEGVSGYVLFVINEDDVSVDSCVGADLQQSISLLLAMSTYCGHLANELSETAADLEGSMDEG